MKTLVLNGWAASPEAWDRCAFRRERIYSYTEALDGEFERDLVAESSPVVAVGWSMGGSILLENVARHPRHFAGIVLVAASVRMMRDVDWKGMNETRLSALRRGLDLSLLGQGVFSPLDPSAPNPYMSDGEGNLSRGLDYLRSLDCRAELAAASARGDFDSVEVRVFQSERDAVVGPQNVRFIEGVFPRARAFVVAGAEHALPVTCAGIIDEAVRELQGNVKEGT